MTEAPRRTVLGVLAAVVLVVYFLTSKQEPSGVFSPITMPAAADEQRGTEDQRRPLGASNDHVAAVGVSASGPLGFALANGHKILDALYSRPTGAPVDSAVCAVGSVSRMSKLLLAAFPTSLITIFDPQEPEANSGFVTHEVQQVDESGRCFAYYGRLSYSMVSFLTIFPTRKCTLVILEGGSSEQQADVSNLKSMTHAANCVVASTEWINALKLHPRWRKVNVAPGDASLAGGEHIGVGQFITGRLPFPSRALEAILRTGAWRDVDLRPFDKFGAELTKSALTVAPDLEGHSAQLVLERQMYVKLARLPNVKTICEIGFNAGHSASLWLLANPKARVIMFDIFIHAYSRHNEQFIRSNGPSFGLADANERLTTVVGSSLDTVVQFAKNNTDVVCDILSVDGYHDHDFALFDLAHMRRLANPKFHVLVVDDTNCNFGWWCVQKAVVEREFRGDVEVLARVGEHPWAPDRGYARGVTVLQYTSVPDDARHLPVSKVATDM